MKKKLDLVNHTKPDQSRAGQLGNNIIRFGIYRERSLNCLMTNNFYINLVWLYRQSLSIIVNH